MALWNSISEILWNVGEKTKVNVCLPGDVPHISHSHAYFQDNVTEKLWIFEFTKLEDLQIFIKRYLFYFTDDPVSCYKSLHDKKKINFKFRLHFIINTF
jgi:ubiquitin carboxyl-terminal hydrolase MINDY-3/4